MIRNYSLGPFPTGSVQIRNIVANMKNKGISQAHSAILKRMEHYVNGAHIQLERVTKDIELMRKSSPFEDGWDIGLWCQMLDAHFLAISVNIAANLANALANELLSINPNWSEIESNFKVLDNEFLSPLRDALEHMDERLRGFKRGRSITPKPAAFEIDVGENGVLVFKWGDTEHNLNKMVDDLTVLFEKTIQIVEQSN